MAIRQFDRSGDSTVNVVNDLAFLVKIAKFDKKILMLIFRRIKLVLLMVGVLMVMN